ncbi:MAG: hypothetical protein IIY48_08305, partial [Clostridia bacterium]|nr:hypothetical protein [Clostridia bacterium]MBQ1528783.1 hypothetical protein [Clostridia bacterium]MBQ5580167.1 hypothetical protein [Clostridia bacterium]
NNQHMPLIFLPSEKAGRGRGPGTGEGGFLSHSLASPSPGNQLNKFGFYDESQKEPFQYQEGFFCLE